MKTEKIVKALRFCARDAADGGCKGCPLDYDHPCDTGCIRELAAAAADEIEKLMARCARYAEEIMVLQERQRWIPVTERLPEDERHVLTFIGYADSMVGFMSVSCYFAHDTVPHWQWDGLIRDPQQRTLFWMPLPAPPEAE